MRVRRHGSSWLEWWLTAAPLPRAISVLPALVALATFMWSWRHVVPDSLPDAISWWTLLDLAIVILFLPALPGVPAALSRKARFRSLYDWLFIAWKELEVGPDSRAATKETPEWENTARLLFILNLRLQIWIPEDPAAHTNPESHRKLAQLVSYARMGNLEAARALYEDRGMSMRERRITDLLLRLRRVG